MPEKVPDNFKRYRFSVPNADMSVIQWIAAQSNLSFSIRELIKTAIRCNGFSDVSCYPVRQILMEVPMHQIPPGTGYPMEYALLAQGQGFAQAQQAIQPPVSQSAQMAAPAAGTISQSPSANPVGPSYPQPAPQPAPVSSPAPQSAQPAAAPPLPQSAPAAAPPPQPAPPVGQSTYGVSPDNAPEQTFVDPEDALRDLMN